MCFSSYECAKCALCGVMRLCCVHAWQEDSGLVAEAREGSGLDHTEER